MQSLKEIILNKDYAALRNILSQYPALANEGIPYDEHNTTKAHPLHRICDAVFAGNITDEEAVETAKIFLEYGADINGKRVSEKDDTPLVAAASLHADKVALLYIERGANIYDTGCHGGTALHWAAWCGREKVAERLIQAGAEINKRCIDFTSTPLFWAVHGLKHGGYNNTSSCVACVKMLLDAGADKNVPNAEGTIALELLNEGDEVLKKLLS